MMNLSAVVQAATETACLVGRAVREHANVLVLGGDCSIELGVVAGFRSSSESIGLIYADLDTDLQTPLSTQDGAFDWMGVAHLLGVEGTAPELAMMGPTFPLLSPDEVFLFGHKNVKEPEQRLISSLGIKGVHADEVAADPEGAAWYAALEWGARFDRLLIHFDVDLIDFESFPIAENTRRKMGLSFEQAMRAVRTLLQARNWASLTVTEVNPDHGHVDGTTIRAFVDRLSSVLVSRQPA
jgi:arginase